MINRMTFYGSKSKFTGIDDERWADFDEEGDKVFKMSAETPPKRLALIYHNKGKKHPAKVISLEGRHGKD